MGELSINSRITPQSSPLSEATKALQTKKIKNNNNKIKLNDAKRSRTKQVLKTFVNDAKGVPKEPSVQDRQSQKTGIRKALQGKTWKAIRGNISDLAESNIPRQGSIGTNVTLDEFKHICKIFKRKTRFNPTRRTVEHYQQIAKLAKQLDSKEVNQLLKDCLKRVGGEAKELAEVLGLSTSKKPVNTKTLKSITSAIRESINRAGPFEGVTIEDFDHYDQTIVKLPKEDKNGNKLSAHKVTVNVNGKKQTGYIVKDKSIKGRKQKIYGENSPYLGHGSFKYVQNVYLVYENTEGTLECKNLSMATVEDPDEIKKLNEFNEKFKGFPEELQECCHNFEFFETSGKRHYDKEKDLPNVMYTLLGSKKTEKKERKVQLISKKTTSLLSKVHSLGVNEKKSIGKNLLTFLQICLKEGYSHGDIKPENLTAEGKQLDFDTMTNSDEGTEAFTPAYTPPWLMEQGISVSKKEMVQKRDLFAVAAVLFEMEKGVTLTRPGDVNYDEQMFERMMREAGISMGEEALNTQDTIQGTKQQLDDIKQKVDKIKEPNLKEVILGLINLSKPDESLENAEHLLKYYIKKLSPRDQSIENPNSAPLG